MRDPFLLFILLCSFLKGLVLAQGKTQGSTLTMHQQTLTTGPFSNTCEADAVSPKVAIGGCMTHSSTTRGNAIGIKETTHRDQIIISKHKLLRTIIYQM
jgi:hypothetical protein